MAATSMYSKAQNNLGLFLEDNDYELISDLGHFLQFRNPLENVIGQPRRTWIQTTDFSNNPVQNRLLSLTEFETPGTEPDVFKDDAQRKYSSNGIPVDSNNSGCMGVENHVTFPEDSNSSNIEQLLLLTDLGVSHRSYETEIINETAIEISNIDLSNSPIFSGSEENSSEPKLMFDYFSDIETDEEAAENCENLIDDLIKSHDFSGSLPKTESLFHIPQNVLNWIGESSKHQVQENIYQEVEQPSPKRKRGRPKKNLNQELNPSAQIETKHEIFNPMALPPRSSKIKCLESMDRIAKEINTAQPEFVQHSQLSPSTSDFSEMTGRKRKLSVDSVSTSSSQTNEEERKRKNNDASKKSRDKKKQTLKQVEEELVKLRVRHEYLKDRLETLKSAVSKVQTFCLRSTSAKLY